MTDSRLRKTSRKMKRLNRKDTIKLVDYLRGNADRITKLRLTMPEIESLVLEDTGFDVNWNLIRLTADAAGADIKLKYKVKCENSRVDETLGQLCVMVRNMAPALDISVLPLVALAARQYEEEDE